jgi:hypothetical protein
LRGVSSLPEILLPAHLMLEEDLEAIFSNGRSSPPDGIIVKRTINRKNHQAAIVFISNRITLDNNGPHTLVCQVYNKKRLVHNTRTILGKIGCVKLIRDRISEELKFILEKPTKLPTEDLAEYISPQSVDAMMKFLDRLDTGQTVNELTVEQMCRKLLIDMEDVAFSVPVIYQNRERAAKVWRPTLWAEKWSEWTKLFGGIIELDVPSYNIFFKIIPDNQAEDRVREIAVAFGPVYKSIISYSKAPAQLAERLLTTAADELHRLGFDCWVSYREGLRAGEPDQRPKLFLTVARTGSTGRVVVLEDYLRCEVNSFFDLLPKPLPYIR